jgi:hypothetical protein
MFTNIEALLTPEGVATAMLQAALENRRDLTMVPNPEISRALEIYTADPDKAERKMGQAMRQAISRTQP